MSITPDFNKYPKIANFDEVIFIAQQAYELGFRGGTGEELYAWLKSRLDLTGLSNTAGLPEDFPAPGSTLSATNKGEWTILTPGIYNKATSGTIVVEEGNIAFAQYDGEDYNLVRVVEMPLPAGVDTIDPDGDDIPKEKAVAKYTYSKSEYVYHNLVDTIEPNLLRESGTEVSNTTRRLELLKKLDKVFNKIEVVGLKCNERLCLYRFTYRPDDDIINFGISVVSLDTGDYTESYTNNINYSENNIELTVGSGEVSILFDLDIGDLGSKRLDFQFYKDDEVFYPIAGFKQTSLNIIPDSPIWGNGYRLRTAGDSTKVLTGENYYFRQAVKSIKIESTRKELISIQQIGWHPNSNSLLFLFVSCLDDDDDNLKITEDRAGFSYLRAYIPKGSTGLVRSVSTRFSGTTESKITLIVDCDILNREYPNFENINTVAVLSPSYENLIANWVVSPSSGGGGGGFFSQLTLLNGSEDFEGNYSFNSTGNNWSYNVNYNMSKLIRIPDGADEIQFNMQFGANANADWIDENLKRIGKVHSGNNTVSNIKVDIPNNARFIRACTQTDVNEASIIAYGEMEISGQVNTYRSLHEGLGDRYSGKIFKVGNVIFEKDLDGLCTLYEYKSLNSFMDSIPEFELDGSKLQPLNVPYTGNNGTFDYGSYCAEKDGVLYFYNSRACAVFKTEDYGQTYITISDKFSHPDLWDTQDVNGGQTSGVVVPLSDGEILFQVRHRGDKFIDEQNSQRKERFFILCRTKNNQTDVDHVLTFSHEDTLRHWLDPNNPQYNYPNHSGGVMLSDYSHDIWEDLIVITEYGNGTSYYWQEKGIGNNANGISGKAWASLDGGITWKKFFDADRKKTGENEDDDNWYWFTSTEARKLAHIHGIFIDKVNGVVHITNGDSEDYDWKVKVSDLKAWYQNAPAIDPGEHPEYKTSDTFPATDSFMLTHNDERWHNAYSFMKPQQMAGTPIEGGLLWGHDASREFAYISRKTDNGEMLEPVFPFEYIDDYGTIQEFVASWGGTDGFVQDIKVIDGVIFFIHSHSKTPNRIWASRDGYNWKIVLEMPVETFGFGAKIFKSNGSFYVSNKQTLADNEIGYWKLKEK